MRFIIYGAGGVGGVIGAQLHKAGTDIALIARGEHLGRLQTEGLRYQTPFVDECLQLPAFGHPEEIEPREDDVVIMTMKSQHTEAALDALRAVRGSNIPVVCCQNSVANERMALRRFAQVYAMLVYLPAQLTEPGTIQCHAKLKSGVLDLSVYPGGVDARCQTIADHLNAANFSVVPNPTVMRYKYAKLVMNLNNAVDALISKDEDTKAFSKQVKAEAYACLDAAGIDYASADEVRDRRKGVFESGDIPGVARVGGSSRQSLLRRTGDIEADFLNGEIVLLGRLHGVATPANAALQVMSEEAARRRLPPGNFSLADIEAQMQLS